MSGTNSGVQRVASVIQVNPEKLDEYKALHAAVWPAVLDRIHRSNIRNYSVFHRNGYLFSYFEYVGDDYDADMRKLGEDEATQRWWAICGPMQIPLADRATGEWWARMEEVFHTSGRSGQEEAP